MPDTSSAAIPSAQVKEAELATVRTWLNARPDLLLAIAKRHTANQLLTPVQKGSTKLPKLEVPYGGLTADKVRIKISTKARNVEVDIPLPTSSHAQAGSAPASGLGKGAFGNRVEQMALEALRHFDVPLNPRVTTFLPPSPVTASLLGPLAVLLFLIFAPSTNSYANTGRVLVRRWLGEWAIPVAGWVAAIPHLVVEPIILLGRLRKHRVPLIPSSLYLLAVVLLGYGGLDALNRAVIQERTRLVYSYSPEQHKKSQ